jgi:hypothetical protein
MNVKNFVATDYLTANTLFRLTLANHIYNLPLTFPDQARQLYESLYARAQVIPTTYLAILPGEQTAVIDVDLKVDELGAALVNALDAAGTQWAYVDTVELLSAADAEDSSSQAGTDARARAQQAAAAKTPLTQLLDKFNALGAVVKWSIAGIAILAAVYVLSPILRRKS